MEPTRRLLLLTLSLAPCTSRSEDGHVVFEGMRFDRRVRIAGADLRLNGTGLRAVAWFKGFAAALYLSGQARTADQAVAMAGPKRIQLRLFHDVPAVEFAKAFRKGTERNAPPADVPRMADRLARFEALINALGTVRQDDVVDLDFDPERGTGLYVNGTLQGEPVPGDDFNAALLRSFVGEKPFDKRLRAGLLGQPT